MSDLKAIGSETGASINGVLHAVIADARVDDSLIALCEALGLEPAPRDRVQSTR